MAGVVISGTGIIDALKQSFNLGNDLDDLISQVKGLNDDDYADVERVGRHNVNAPRDNQKQKEQVRSIAKNLD